MRLLPQLAVFGIVLFASAAPADTAPSLTKADAVRLENEITEHMTEANGAVTRLAADVQKLSSLYSKLDEKAGALRKATAACANGCTASQGAALLAASKELEQSQLSFTAQYLALQNQIQNENRSYAAISSILKTKHDTVKNSISNIR